ncbi:MAG: ATP synthase F1 subunit epsilon [Pseudobdellovibrionaceae bacterium]
MATPQTTADEDMTFHFELVSPERKLIEEPAFQVTVPGETGELGVRKGHTSLVVSLRPGLVQIMRQKGGMVEKLFVAGGFADITADNCTLLAEEAVPVAEIDADKVAAEIQNLQEDLERAKTPVETDRIARKITVARAMLRAATA